MQVQTEKPSLREEERERELDRRLDAVGWGLFLIMIGGLWLAPAEWGIPEGAWLVGTGLIILGLLAIRYLNGIKVSGFWLFLGVLALGLGLAAILGLDLPVFPILLIIAGVAILIRPLFDRSRT